MQPVPWVWGDEQQSAFDKLVTSALVLAFADFSLPFEPHNDALGTGLGAILYQKPAGKMHAMTSPWKYVGGKK